MLPLAWKRKIQTNLQPVNMSNNTSRNDAKISAAAYHLASLEVTEGQANAKTSDKSADGATRPSGEGERVLDPELWKPHQPNEDCPVCFVPLPLSERESTCHYWVCCGRMICSACTVEMRRAEIIINAKRAKKKLPPLDDTCPFCRIVPKVSNYEERIRKGDGRAACLLAFDYRFGVARYGIPKD